MMLSFHRYDDEILYSCLARHRIRSGTLSHKALIQDVFGSNRFSACVDLQPGIGRLKSNLPVGCSITSEQIIFNNTMYLYHTTFRSTEKAKAIFQEMMGDDGRNLQNSIGLMSSAIRPNAYFMHCPICSKEDLLQHGEMFFRRIHQIAGIQVCLKHGVWLNQSEVLVHPSNAYMFTAATPENCNLENIRMVLDELTLSQYCYLINGIERILSINYPNRELDWLYCCYKSRIKQKGYVSIKGMVDQQQIQRDFLNFYGEVFLGMVQSSIEGESNWLRLFFQKHRKPFPPIRHLLVLRFLGLTLEDIFYNHNQDNVVMITHIDKPKRKIMKKTMTEEYKSRSRQERHEVWLKLREENPHLGMNDLRKLSPKTYAWLYLYDRPFLFEHAPQKVGSRGGQFRVNWQDRDQDTLVKVERAFNHLRNEVERPNRITIARIQEVIGEKCLQKKYLDKMPATKQLLEQIVETPEQFGERRIQWVITQMQKDGEPLLWWRVIRKAGIKREKPADWDPENISLCK